MKEVERLSWSDALELSRKVEHRQRKKRKRNTADENVPVPTYRDRTDLIDRLRYDGPR